MIPLDIAPFWKFLFSGGSVLIGIAIFLLWSVLDRAGFAGERVSGQRGTSEASGSGVSPNGTPDARDRDEGAGTPK